MRRVAGVVVAGCVALGAVGGPPAAAQVPPAVEPHVVVATLDTGTNPFHPAWRREQHAHPSTFIPGYPADADALNLTFTEDFAESVEASSDELDKLADKAHPYWIPGTNIIGTWAHSTDVAPIFDRRPNSTSHSHGAAASSQIAGTDLGLAPEAFVVIMDRTPDGGANVYQSNAEGLRWAADQPWIDIIHTNIQDPVPLSGKPPIPGNYPDAVRYALSKGKVVVSAGGNFYAEATETSPHAGPPGVLVAGANDNCGYTDYSNPNPHVVMDGYGTVAAHPSGYGTTTFSGTSSASPRISGYVAQLLLQIRREVGFTGGVTDGALVVLPEGATPPAQGPLADGRLTAAELHEVVRKTADPNPHASKWDGGMSICVPQPAALPFAFYPKMGYGEVSEHTIGAALDVAMGRAALPERPMEDSFYDVSEQLRHAFWD